MNDINSLKDIGLNEVARKTHIEVEYLGYILNKNYEKLARLNAKGFLKILEREYNVDSKEWLEGYNNFLNEHKEEFSHRTATVSPKISAYSPTDKMSSKIVWLIILLAIIGFLVWFFEAYKHIGSISNLFEDKNRSVSYTNTVAVEQAEKNVNSIKDANITINLPTPTIETNQINLIASPEINQTVQTPTPSIEANQSIQQNTAPVEQSDTQKDGNETSITESITPNKNRSTAVGSEYATIGINEVKIVPRKKVWIGVIDLENNKKRSVDTSNDFAINLGVKQLVVTGHGEVNLDIAGDVIKFDTDNPKRFLIEKDKITLIDYDKFVSLNKGKSW